MDKSVDPRFTNVKFLLLQIFQSKSILEQKVDPGESEPVVWIVGAISLTVSCLMLTIHALCQTFTPQKAFQNMGVGCEQFGVGRKPAFEIDFCLDFFKLKPNALYLKSKITFFKICSE